jgi:hypothetical protein
VPTPKSSTVMIEAAWELTSKVPARTRAAPIALVISMAMPTAITGTRASSGAR